MRKFYLLALMAMVAISCQRDDYVLQASEDQMMNEHQMSVNEISEEEAILTLTSVLEQIDPETRGVERKIKGIEPITFNDLNPATTRTHLDTTKLLYLVNFENNNGYAVLSANKEISPRVLFITDMGSADIDDFIIHDDTRGGSSSGGTLTIGDLYYAPADDYYLGDVNPQSSGLILQQDIINNVVSLRNDVNDNSPVDDLYLPHVITSTNVSPLLETLWHQRHPYNLKFPLRDASGSERHVVGCTTIATGQLLTYLADRDLHNQFNIANVTWEDIEEFKVMKSDTLASTDTFDIEYITSRDAVASLLNTIAVETDVVCDFGIGDAKGTFGLPKKVAEYLAKLEYNVTHIKNEANFSKDVQSLVNESLSRRIPVIVGALGSAYGHASGHCWVIDGCKYIHNQQDWVNHINLGWGGSGNGWYFRDCFKSEDVYEDANSRTKDITISPLASEDEFKYTWMFNIIIVQ